MFYLWLNGRNDVIIFVWEYIWDLNLNLDISREFLNFVKFLVCGNVEY